MTGTVFVVENNFKKGIELPESSWIQKSEKQGEVWVFNHELGALQKVILEIDDHGHVISGLASNMLIACAGIDELSEGQRVRVWEREGGI